MAGDGAGILQSLVDQRQERRHLHILRRSDPDKFAFCCKKFALAAGRMEGRWETGEGPLVAIGDNDAGT